MKNKNEIVFEEVLPSKESANEKKPLLGGRFCLGRFGIACVSGDNAFGGGGCR